MDQKDKETVENDRSLTFLSNNPVINKFYLGLMEKGEITKEEYFCLIYCFTQLIETDDIITQELFEQVVKLSELFDKIRYKNDEYYTAFVLLLESLIATEEVFVKKAVEETIASNRFSFTSTINNLYKRLWEENQHLKAKRFYDATADFYQLCSQNERRLIEILAKYWHLFSFTAWLFLLEQQPKK